MRQYIVDAFTDKVFHGNPAAICFMEDWLPEDTMMAIARENCLSETAFLVQEGAGYRLRWFTPGGEIDLCGHATLASAYVLMTILQPDRDTIVFHTLSGDLTVERKGALFEMAFPAYDLVPVEITDAMVEAMGARPKEAYMGRDLLCVFEGEDIVRDMAPDMEKVKALDGLLLQVTAPGRDHDCVSRSFAPKLDVREDPVCGSGQCHIFPYWAMKTHKDELVGWQASPRGGTIYGRVEGDRVMLSGKAVLFAVSEIHI